MTPPADDLVRRLQQAMHLYNLYTDTVAVRLMGEAAAAIVERDQRIAALTTDLAATQHDYQTARDAHDDKMQLWQAAERRAEADAADAKRYRWLRESPDAIKTTGVYLGNVQLDAAIDAAIAAQDAP